MLKFDYPADYTGTNLNHRRINEKRKLIDPISRVITLDYGAFFVESLVIRNVATARPLVRGLDYACVELDTLASERSGKHVSSTILISNKQATDIEIDYIFVGGQHMSGQHLIKELKSVYPNGLEPKYHWDNILNKPETFKSKSHVTHVNELYGFDGVTKSLSDMIDALGFKEQRLVNQVFDKVMTKLNEMDIALDEYIATTEATIEQAFQNFRVQDNEFIFTNTAENPAVKRGYGTWELVSNTVLKGDNGDNAYVVGSDSVIALGNKLVVRNCYVWKNKSNSKAPTFTISSPLHSGLPASQRKEDQDIVIDISTTSLATDSKLAWVIIDTATKEPVSGHLLYTPFSGEATVDALGKAQVVVKFRPDTKTPATNRSYSFRLLRTSAALFDFTVIDSSLEKRIELAFTVDAAGLRPVVKVEEAQEFFLQIKYVGNWKQGEVAHLDWTTSSIGIERVMNGTNPVPKTIVVPSSPTETYAIKVLANTLTDSKQTLLVYALQEVNEHISSVTSYTTVEVNDSSRFNYATVTFNDKTTGVGNVARIDEDVSFEIVIETNILNTELNIIYNTTKSISDFSGLVSKVTTDAQGKVVITAATTADFLTNIGSQSITVQVEVNNTSLGYNTLFINDTSKTPNYQVFFSTQDVNQVITQINEGEKFFLNIKVDDWQPGVRAPSLEFNYTLNEVNDTPIELLRERVNSTLYPAMLFDQSSTTYNEVTWVNGNTLRFEFNAIADKLVKGDVKLGVMVKQSNQNQFDKVSYLTILDTSVPTVVGSWSSSATELTPITQVDEMQSNGLNQRCYLWIDIDGDGGSFGDITLKSNSANGVDFVTLFPNVIKLANGISRHIVTVDAKSDFVAEGNKTLYVAGSYKNDRNQDVELFRSSIVLVDNSILTALDAVTSTSNTAIVPASAFSEWQSFYAVMTYPEFAFDTQIEWRAEFTNNPSGLGQLAVSSGVLEVAKYAGKSTLTLTPVKDRLKDGESTFTLYYRRKIKATGQYITTEKSLTGIKILDDSLPTDIVLKVYTDPARTVLAPAFVNEGTKLYLRATVTNPDRDYSVCFGVADALTVQAVATNGTTVNLITSTDVPSRVIINDRRVVAVVPATPGESSVNVDAEFTVVADRTSLDITAVNPDGVRIVAKIVDNSSNQFPVGSAVPFANNGSANKTQVIGFNDTSKTAIYSIAGPSSVAEGEAFRIDLSMNDGTVGDVYYSVLLAGPTATRLSVNELGLEQLGATSTATLRWNFKFAPDYKTTGNINVTIGIINKTTGLQVGSKTFVLNDTSVEPILNAMNYNPSDIFWSNDPIVEGRTDHVLGISSDNNQLTTGEIITIEWVSGRPASEFNAGLFGNHVIPVPVNGSYQRVTYPMILAYDRKTNTVAENKVTIKVTAGNSGVSKQFTFDIVDISQTPAITSVAWKNATGNVVTSINEGEKVKLEIKAAGGTHGYGLTLTNDEGRSIARLNSHEYGVTRTRNSDNDLLVWNFDVKAELLSNVGDDTRLKVKLTSPTSGVNLTASYTLPINDTSNNTVTSMKIVKNDGSTNAVNYLEEGVSYKLIAGTSAPSDSEYYALNWGHNKHYFPGPINDYIQNVLSDGSYIDYDPVVFTLNDPNRTPADKLWFKASVTVSGQEKSVIELPVIDSKVPLVIAKLTNLSDINTAISTANEGTTIKLVVDPNLFTGINWGVGTNHRIKWTAVVASDESVPSGRFNTTSGYITQASLTSFNGGQGFQTNIGILANEVTNTTNNVIKVILVEEYVVGGITQYIRMGQTNNLTIKDTSPLPSIDRVYFTKSQLNTSEEFLVFTEGENFFVHIWATGLTNDGSSTDINLTWDGTASDADFVSTRPVKVRMDLVDANTRQYFGTSFGIGIHQEMAEG